MRSALGLVASAKRNTPPASGIQIIEMKRYWTGPGAATGPATMTLDTTPQAGDVVLVYYMCLRQSSVRSISSVAGLGATWAIGYNSFAAHSIWRGVGATASGSITITQSSPAPMDVLLLLIRGSQSPPVFDGQYSGGSASRIADAGELVVTGFHSANNGSTQPTYPTGTLGPATGWTFLPYLWDGFVASCYGYRFPTATATHTVASSGPVGGIAATSVVVVT